MKKLILAIFLLFPFSLNAQTQTYQLDTQSSVIGWVGKKITGQHNGTIRVKSGKLTLDPQKIMGGDFVLDMTSIQVSDIKDPAKNQKLANHLKSDDFFSVDKFPEGKFKITSIQVKNPDLLEVVGDLTLKGITHPVTIPVTYTREATQVKAKGKVVIDRTKWDVRYGSGKFFKQLGDKLISDDIELDLDLTAKPAVS